MIDFSAKSWLEQYLAYRQQHPLRPSPPLPLAEELPPGQKERFESLRHPLYSVLQASGIAYGFPVDYPFELEELPKGLRRSDRAKIILLDTLLYMVLQREGMPVGPAYRETVAAAGRHLRYYYHSLHQAAFDERAGLVEDILFRRVQYRKHLFDFRRSGINSQLFWDLYFFRHYYRAQQSADAPLPASWFEEMLAQKREMKILTVKIMAAAVHADWEIARQERFLGQQFQRSSGWMRPGERAMLRNLFQMGVAVEDVQIPPGLSWLGRRYLMDIALLSVYADADIDLQEDSMLRALAFRLKISNDELLSGKASLGAFLYQFGPELHFYQARKAGLLLIGQAIYENVSKLSKAARMEAVETRDMARTFGTLFRNRLGPGLKEEQLPGEAEIQAAFRQLKDLPRFLPFFSFLFMPVPGITELYILFALSLEKLSAGQVSLLPSQLRKVVGAAGEEEE